MPRWIVLMAVVAAMFVYGAGPASAQRPGDLKTFDFVLGGMQYRILLPAHATLMPRSGARSTSSV